MVTDQQIPWPDGQTWLTVPDVAETLELSVSQVRRLIEEKSLAAVRIDGALRIPAAFLQAGEPLKELKGTLVLLADSGYSDDEAVYWLLVEEESLGTAPIDALLAGRKTEVRRVAQALGF